MLPTFSMRRFGPKHWPARGPDPRLDVVVVPDPGRHQLVLHDRSEDNDAGTAQLEVLLLQDLPEANIMSFLEISEASHETLFTTWGLQYRARALLTSLLEKRNTTANPVIFAGFGIGCLVIMQALMIAQNERLYSSIRRNTSHLVFTGIPPNATGPKSWEIQIVEMMGTSDGGSTSGLSEALGRFSKTLMETCEGFSSLADRYQLVSFVKEEKTSQRGMRVCYSFPLSYPQHFANIMLAERPVMGTPLAISIVEPSDR
ncbi:hypothetical protein EPUS_06487 [Endocarpon pusillum Z07020]|uniref:Uncharacterized protein n=1 Tax=Endocarpon pusillum (strain Z07020 / HMAS-L-300199) TaxID=1263415 RepID=U1GIG9_ENDPU|nr:uncharacterized protein EPUS_06487 [Endocarpon pusillum Z07020]ERF71928.1 hypothetical protein EPUS_06487 [Endocarpon pusillum Z07020]